MILLMAKKKNQSDEVAVKDAPDPLVEEAGNHDELEAYFYYRSTGSNALGYVEPTRDQEPDVAPEKGVAPGADLFNPEPSQAAQDQLIARSAENSRDVGYRSAYAAKPHEEKEENRDEFLDAEVTPQDFAGADEEGNIPEPSAAGSALPPQPVVVVDDKSEKS